MPCAVARPASAAARLSRPETNTPSHSASRPLLAATFPHAGEAPCSCEGARTRPSVSVDGRVRRRKVHGLNAGVQSRPLRENCPTGQGPYRGPRSPS